MKNIIEVVKMNSLEFYYIKQEYIEYIRQFDEKIGRNPQTGAELKIPAATTPAFKAGKTLKEKVNK